MAATNEQVQRYVDERCRPHAEALRSLLLALKDDKAAIDDVYANVSDGASTFADNRTDGPPFLISKNDVLAYNAYITALIPHIEEAADFAVMMQFCVRPVEA